MSAAGPDARTILSNININSPGYPLVLSGGPMSDFDNRSEKRKKVCVHAFAFDTKDSFNIKCVIRDVSESGCMIVSSQTHDLPEFIQLVPERFNRPLRGKIVWRDDKRAGISFLSPAQEDGPSLLKEYYLNALRETDSGEPLLLEAYILPLSYADRLAKYVPPKK